VVERALTIFLNTQEIVTAMTIGDYPDYLALGYLLNQNMLQVDDVVTEVEYHDDLAVVVVRTERATNYEQKMKKKVQTSGCAQGTVFGDLMEVIENARLPAAELRTSWLYALTHAINTTPSLYLEAGAIHGCVLALKDRPLVYMEDVGRHNAVDKIAGWMFKHNVRADDKIFYTTGRLTSEMVIKTVRMGIPILVSRSGFTAWGVELARKANLTLIGRARGKRFVALAGESRIVFDQDLAFVEEEGSKHRRKAAVHEE
jgi:FdhD protein